MKRVLNLYIHFLFICVAFFSVQHAEGQELRLEGRVLSDETGLPISGATIKLQHNNQGTSSDKLGNFLLLLERKPVKLQVNAMGFTSKEILLDSLPAFLQIHLEPKGIDISAVDIHHKRKYNNRNPATEIIDLVIKNRAINKLEKKDSLYFQKYEKVKVGLVDPKSVFGDRVKNISFFYNNVDSSVLQGEAALNIFMQETLSDNYIQQHPARNKKIIKAENKTEFDPRYVNNPNIESFIGYMFQPVDIYEESIYFINKQFLSPIASSGKLYYKYYLRDTIRTDKEFFVRIDFSPRNMTDVLFNGHLVIAMDGSYAVKSAHLELDKKANVAWVNQLELNLSYFKDASGVMLQDTSEVMVAFGRGKRDALFGQMLSVNEKYDLSSSPAEGIFSGAPIEKKLRADVSMDTHRPVALNLAEYNTYRNIDSLNNLSSFKALMTVGYLVSQGYYSVGKFEFGPIEYLYHKNNIEGHRVRIGGRSTSAFSEKVYLEGYLAYGSKDQDLKYNIRSAFTLNGKAVTEFPAHYIEGYVQHDIFEPGKGLGFLKGDSFFRSFRSNKPTKYLNTDAYRLSHVLEFGNHLSISSQLTLQRRDPIGDLKFALSADPSQYLHTINTTDVQFMLRWAPHEKFYYRNLSRKTIIEKHPVFNIQYNRGIDGFLGGDYNYDALRLSASKRLMLNQLGYGDARFTVGKIWGTLPYPLLEMPNIQELRDRHTISYELTNPMEFVADKFLKFSYDHRLNGFILNKVPLVKKLKLREIFGARMFWGELSAANNPYLSNSVVHFDRDEQGEIMTRVLSKEPYWEGYVGLDNIFKVLRVQYFARMTYNQVKEPVKDKFRFSLHFSF